MLSDLVVETPKTVPSVFTLTVFLLLNHLFIFYILIFFEIPITARAFSRAYPAPFMLSVPVWK